MAIGLKAQTYVGELLSYPKVIPGSLSNNGHPYIEYSLYDDNTGTYTYSIYDCDFTTHVTDIDINDGTIVGIDYYIVDNTLMMCYPTFTQNIFNTDDNFEFLVLHYTEPEIVGYITINSSDGSIIETIYPDNGYRFSDRYYRVYRIENNCFMVLMEHGGSYYQGNYEEKYLIYQISQTQGLIKLDAELPISVFPTVADRGQQITVELGENSNATEITVVNELGQVVNRVPVNGQSSVTIPTTGLGSGLNILNTNTAKGNSGCKIIIK